MKNISLLSENFKILEVKFSIFLNRRIFVMYGEQPSNSAERKGVEPNYEAQLSNCAERGGVEQTNEKQPF